MGGGLKFLSMRSGDVQSSPSTCFFCSLILTHTLVAVEEANYVTRPYEEIK